MLFMQGERLPQVPDPQPQRRLQDLCLLRKLLFLQKEGLICRQVELA
jgi:hypothetical protein